MLYKVKAVYAKNIKLDWELLWGLAKHQIKSIEWYFSAIKIYMNTILVQFIWFLCFSVCINWHIKNHLLKTTISFFVKVKSIYLGNSKLSFKIYSGDQSLKTFIVSIFVLYFWIYWIVFDIKFIELMNVIYSSRSARF